MSDVVRMNPGNHKLPDWLSNWSPPGAFDPQARVFLGPSTEVASFPDEGIDLFGDVDEQSFWFKHRAGVVSDLLAEHVEPKATILEVGSGSGAVAAQLAEAGYAVMAVEPSTGGAARARERGADVAFDGTLHEAELPDAAFGVVGFFDVIEHLDDWQVVVEEARRVLRPDGHLLVTVPAYQWLWSEHDDWNEHKRRYSRAKLIADLEAAGFRVERASYFFAPLLVPALVRRLVYLTGRRRGQEHQEHLRHQLQPNDLVNTALSQMLRLERRLVCRRSLPFGTSLCALASPCDGGPS